MKSFFLCVLLGFLFSSCVKNNPDPAWLEVNQWTLEKNSNATYPAGELSQNFTEAWVFVDEQIIGVFEVPFKIPILKNGNVNIKIYPAIKNNGISATKKIYPFMEVFEVDAELIQNKTLTLNPITRYYASTQFWIEDFEDASIKLTNDLLSLAKIISGNDASILKYGNKYGHLTLTETDSSWSAYTNVPLVLPKGGKEVYLEIDYYNTNGFTTGVLAITQGSIVPNSNIQLNKQDPSSVKWKKMYIELKEIVSYSTKAEYFEISFEALLEAGLTSSDIYIDNIKVVYF